MSIMATEPFGPMDVHCGRSIQRLHGTTYTLYGGRRVWILAPECSYGAYLAIDSLFPEGQAMRDGRVLYAWHARRAGSSVMGSALTLTEALSAVVSRAAATDETGALNFAGSVRGIL